MFHYKQINLEAVPRALAKAERYRLLNEPEEAESICHDILGIDPNNQQALITLILALTDTFHQASAAGALSRSKELLSRLSGAYERMYYEGVICERWAKAQFNPHRPSPFAYHSLREAMACYEKAEAVSPPDNNDAVLRWNACARFIEGSSHLRAEQDSIASEPGFGDEVPPR